MLTPVRKQILLKAAEIFDQDALEIARVHKVGGRWPMQHAADRAALEDATRRTTLAEALRRMVRDT